MKKNLFLFVLLAIVAMSCQKDIAPVGSDVASGKTNEVTPATKTSLFDEAKPIENDDVYKKIDAFKAKIESIKSGTVTKSGVGTSVEDAIWNIEALLNSQYGQAGKPFKDIHRSTSTIRVDLNDDGTIDNTALVTALETARQKFLEQFNAVNAENKHVIGIDISTKTPQAESNSSLLLNVTGVLGLRYPTTTPFGSADDWLFANHLGHCDNTSIGTDAADRLYTEINNRSPIYTNEVFFTDIQIVYDGNGGALNLSDNVPNDNKRDRLFFWQKYDGDTQPPTAEINEANANYSNCILHDDMNFYYNSGKSAINLLMPVGKTFISLKLYGDAVLIDFNSVNHLHRAEITYGVKHYVIGPPSPN
jgi:hypothetical protein